ncbi:MAG: Metallophosphoesterase [Planctomycetaceae bacterium]|nr:Metallophosphoesterase [Planctomycetaceae bacterium]
MNEHEQGQGAGPGDQQQVDQHSFEQSHGHGGGHSHGQGHGGEGGGGGGGASGVKDYGVVVGRPVDQKVPPPKNPRDQPHLHILIDAGQKYDVAVNILSQDNSEVLYRVVSHFTPARATELLALSFGAHPIGSNDPNGFGLDFVRQNLVTRDQMTLLPIDPDNMENDLHNSVADFVQSVINDTRARMFAFGSQFHNPGRSPFWDVTPDLGIHEIHMNQGNPQGNHSNENGTYQDGALLAFFPSTGLWSAVFLAFQSQHFTNLNASGIPGPTRGPSRLVVNRPRPLTMASPADFHARFDSRQMNHIKGTLHPIPPPSRTPVMDLSEVIGAHEVSLIKSAGQIVFHAVGDTGKGAHSAQSDVIDAMAADFDQPNPADHPAFFFHLGDVIYGPGKDVQYRDEFYSPNSHYPGRILAIPGNHDGEVFDGTDPVPLKAFLANFCASSQTVPSIAGSAMRETETQPGVYFVLESPFVRIIGLDSNSAENPGFISGETVGTAQREFLVEQLKRISGLRAHGDQSALVIAVHHPPYSGGGHSGSQEMLADIDSAIREAGVAPDLVLSAHAHNYQRFTRKFMLNGTSMEIPFIVAGGGGHGLTPLKLRSDAQSSATSVIGQSGDVSLRQYFNGYGYLNLTVTSRILNVDFHAINNDDHAPGEPLDSVTIDLQTHRVKHETSPLTHPLSGEPQPHHSVLAE